MSVQGGSSTVAAAAVVNEAGPQQNPAPTPFETLAHLLGRKTEGGDNTELPARLLAVTGARARDVLLQEAVMQIMELAELSSVHPPSMQWARANPGTALYLARTIYDKALSGSSDPEPRAV
jgi:hypothetical protein